MGVVVLTGILAEEPIQALKVDTTYRFASTAGVYTEFTPVVVHLEPHFGLVSGGTKVTVRGVRLLPAKHIWIGRRQCKVESQNPHDKSLEFITPPRSAAGSWDVIVKTENGSIGVSQVKFTYVTDAKAAPSAPVRNPDVEARAPKRQNTFHRVNAVVVTAMTGSNLIVHSELVPNDKTEHTLAAIRKVFVAQQVPGRALLKSVHVDNARKLDAPYVFAPTLLFCQSTPQPTFVLCCSPLGSRICSLNFSAAPHFTVVPVSSQSKMISVSTRGLHPPVCDHSNRRLSCAAGYLARSHASRQALAQESSAVFRGTLQTFESFRSLQRNLPWYHSLLTLIDLLSSSSNSDPPVITANDRLTADTFKVEMRKWLQECLTNHPTAFHSDRQRLDALCEAVAESPDVNAFMQQQREAVGPVCLFVHSCSLTNSDCRMR